MTFIYTVLLLAILIFFVTMTFYVNRENKIKNEPTQEPEMDKKIKKIITKEKAVTKDTKNLLKADKKMDKKMAKCDIKMRKKK